MQLSENKSMYSVGAVNGSMKKYNLVAGLTCIVAYHAGANAHTVDVKVVQEK